MNRIIKLPVVFLLALSSAATGCIKEDYSNCPTGVYVTFDTSNPKHDYAARVQSVDLYFYDSEGDLTRHYYYEKEQLRRSDRAAYVGGLPAGEYRLLAIVNGGFETQTENVQKFSTIRSRIAGETVKNNLTDFFTAEKQVTVRSGAARNRAERMTLDKHNNNIRLNVLYDGYAASPETMLEAFITENNGVYEFRSGKCVRPCPVRYLPWRINFSGGLPSSFDIPTMHIWHDSEQKGECDVTVVLQESVSGAAAGRSILLNLTRELMKVRDAKTGELLYDTDEKLLFNDEYEITMTIGADFALTALTINDWKNGGVIPANL